MKQKLFTLLFAVLTGIPFSFAWDYEQVTIDWRVYYNLDNTNKTAEVTEYTTSLFNGYVLTIPSTITYLEETYTVTSIGDYAFSAYVPFDDYDNWHFSVSLPNTITQIGYNAFSNNALSAVYISDLVAWNSIIFNSYSSPLSGRDLYLNGNLVTDLVIPANITNIGNAFRGCKSLTSITIGNNVAEIGEYAFEGCTNLTSITIGDGVTNIGSRAFNGCENLSNINVGSGNAIYDSRDNCNAVIKTATNTLILGCKNSSIPTTVTSIGQKAFENRKGLLSVNIPNNVTSIGAGAFYQCRDVTSITIGSGVTTLGAGAFLGCGIGYDNERGHFSNLSSVTCFAAIPPTWETTSGMMSDGVFGAGIMICDNNTDYCGYFYGAHVPLFVPAASLELYQTANGWNGFDPIMAITAQETAETDVSAVSEDKNSVIVRWPSIAGADHYIIDIKQNNKEIYSLTFDSQGVILSGSHKAPALYDNNHKTPQSTQTSNGWQYSIYGLEAGAQYSYSIRAIQGEEELFSQSIVFSTPSTPTTIETIDTHTESHKLLRDGQIFILYGDKTYTLTGQEVK